MRLGTGERTLEVAGTWCPSPFTRRPSQFLGTSSPTTDVLSTLFLVSGGRLQVRFQALYSRSSHPQRLVQRQFWVLAVFPAKNQLTAEATATGPVRIHPESDALGLRFPPWISQMKLFPGCSPWLTDRSAPFLPSAPSAVNFPRRVLIRLWRGDPPTAASTQSAICVASCFGCEKLRCALGLGDTLGEIALARKFA